MKNTCENCVSFDRSKFLNHYATRDAGLCSKFTEVTFKRDTCKHHFLDTNPNENEIFPPLVDVVKLPVIQFDLFQ